MPAKMIEKPLFIPLYKKFFAQFVDGSKGAELRRYGPRWNERTCYAGRPVTLSEGYGRQNRRQAVVTAFAKRHGSSFCGKDLQDIIDLYGTTDVEIAYIAIGDIKELQA